MAFSDLWVILDKNACTVKRIESADSVASMDKTIKNRVSIVVEENALK